MSVDRIVFDTEAYIAHYFDEPGTGVVDGWLNQVYDGKLAGFVSTTTLVEVREINPNIRECLLFGVSELNTEAPTGRRSETG